MKNALIAAVLLLPSLSLAQTEPVYRFQPEPDFQQSLNEAMIPMKPKDAFLGVPACGVLDAKTLRAYTLPEAVKVIAPCMSAVSTRYALSLKADRGVVGTVKNGRGAILGIVMTAGTTTRVGNSMVRDLNYGISLRGGYLLGFKAVVRGENDPAPVVPSLAQEALDRCVMPMVIRSIESGEDFIKYYGGCLRRAPELKVEDLKPWTGHQLGVLILTGEEGAAAEGLNGVVTVNGAKGPVNLDVVAYPKNVFLP
ncbi:MAG: hypothetical protein HY077_12105 [Elusimicrobia bacterium]|nr:hypothetical protein [Elusimicrobiota bacterium]